MNKEIKECLITKEDLTLWIDRPPSNDDLDLCEYLANAVKLKYEFGARIDKAIEYIEHYKPVALEDKILEILKVQNNLYKGLIMWYI